MVPAYNVYLTERNAMHLKKAARLTLIKDVHVLI